MTGLFIDGVRVGGQDGNPNWGVAFNWELIPLGDIERIEIVRGPPAVSCTVRMPWRVWSKSFTRKGAAGYSSRPFR